MLPGAMMLLPPEYRNVDSVDLVNRPRLKVIELLPFNMAVQHSLIGARGKILVHMRSPVIEEHTINRKTASDVDPLISLFRRGVFISRIRQ